MSVGNDVNNLLFRIVVNLDCGLKLLESTGELASEARAALMERILSARDDALMVGQVVRDLEVFWAQEKGAGEDSTAALESRQLRLLVIDDEPKMGRVFKRLLGERAKVEMALTLGEARTSLLAHSFDAIICDLHIPRASVRDFVEELQQERPEDAARLIFITGGLYSEESRQITEESVQPLIFKPFDLDELERAIAAVTLGQGRR